MYNLDAQNGGVIWQCSDWNEKSDEIKDVHFPKSMLKVAELSRELVFSSTEVINNFSLLQKISLHGQEIETLFFKFGFVMPASQNSWD